MVLTIISNKLHSHKIETVSHQWTIAIVQLFKEAISVKWAGQSDSQQTPGVQGHVDLSV